MGLNARAVLAAVLLLTLGARAFLAWKLPLFGDDFLFEIGEGGLQDSDG